MFFLLGKGHQNWRKEVYSEYKHKTPEDREQWHSTPEGEEFSYNELYAKSKFALRKHLPHIGVKVISARGHEADDLSYYIGKKLVERGKECVAVSGDGDWLQLVNDPGVPVYRPMKEDIVDQDNFVEKTGLPPEAIVLHLSVLGGHDNIPKVGYRFGEKSSMKMIQELPEYTTEAVKAWAEEQSAKTYNQLAEEEKIQQLKTNIKLVDFASIPFSEETSRVLDEKMDQKIEFNRDMAELFIKKYQLQKFASILGRKSYRALK